MNCPFCLAPIRSSWGTIFYERGEYDEAEERYEDEGILATFTCENCDAEFAIIENPNPNKLEQKDESRRESGS